jgi:DNA-binding NarL/FixJ family response regulator
MSNVDTPPITVILVDDHAIVRKGLAALIQLDGRYLVVGEAQDGEAALVVAAQTAADVMILDLAMPRLNGLETIRRLHRQRQRLKILVLSMYDDAEFVSQALRDGASGYILKQSLDDELHQALAVVLDGGQYISTGLVLAPPAEQTTADDKGLTAREFEILQLIAEGHTNAEIADKLSISPNTAGRHRANIFEKLGVHSQIELVRLAVKRGWVILKDPPASLRSETSAP